MLPLIGQLLNASKGKVITSQTLGNLIHRLAIKKKPLATTSHRTNDVRNVGKPTLHLLQHMSNATFQG